MRANMGCGDDPWGEIRLDLRRVSGANILADIQKLPFRDQIFNDVHCISVIEHIEGWAEALRELLRVTGNRLILEFPVNSNIILTDVWRILFPSRENLKLFFSIPRRARETLWQINPWIVVNFISKKGFLCGAERIFHLYAGVPSRCWRITAWRGSRC